MASQSAQIAKQRRPLAKAVCFGLGGWFQLQTAMKLGDLVSESSAQLLVAQIINSSGRFVSEFSQCPNNWKWTKTKKRVDIAIKGAYGASNWYGSCEVKWITESMDVDKTRLAIVQDIMRVTFVDTQLLNANFFVLGGTNKGLLKLFDKSHKPKKFELENRRKAFGKLLKRDTSSPKGELFVVNG